jgi:methionine-rich copper-binding protein CopC
MTRIGRAVAAVALALGALVVTATAAAAHAILLATTPSDGSVLRTSPNAVSLRFDEDVFRPVFLTVTGPSGRVDTGATTIKGSVVSVKVRPTTADGAYTVAYRVVSDDGHPVEGGFQFAIGAPAASSTSSSSTGAAAASPQPSARPSTAAVARTGASTTGQASGSHWLAAFVGIAVVLAGAGALLWERLRRGRIITTARERAP